MDNFPSTVLLSDGIQASKNNSNANVISRRPFTDEVVALIKDLTTYMNALKGNQLSDVQLAPGV